jgi:ATP-binding cassette subfamily C protein CydCD
LIHRRLLRQVGPDWPAFTLAVSLGFVGGVLIIIQARLMSQVISRAFLMGQSLPGLMQTLTLLAAVIILRAGFAWAAEGTAQQVAQRVKNRLRNQLFDKLQALGPLHLRPACDESAERSGEIVTTLSEGLEALDAYYAQYLPQAILAAVLPLAYLTFVLPLDRLSGLVLLLTSPLIPLFMLLIGDLAEALTKRQWQDLRRMGGHFLDVLQGLTTLKVFGRSQAQGRVIAQVSQAFRRSTLRVLRVTFLSALALELVATLSTAVVAVEVGLRLLHGRLVFEQAFFVLLLAPEFYLPLRQLGSRFHASQAGAAAARRIFAILDQPQPRYSPSPRPTPTIARRPPEITFEAVSFAYPQGPAVLEEVSFRIGCGERVALVGASGAGKSTLVNLLLRFSEPTQGRVLIDGNPLSDFSLETARQMVAWVPQAPFLFDDTITANLRLAKPGASQAELESAARLACAADFIGALPQGYETRLGEGGARLSAGQAQRLALARAFLKDAPILVLDEPAANLDASTEARLAESLSNLMEGRTVLMVAHSPATIAAADRIVVIADGHLVEQNVPPPAPFTQAQQPAGASSPSLETTAPKLQDLPAQSAALPPRQQSPLLLLLALLKPYLGLVALSVLLGIATVLSAVGLLATSAYLISAAALHPSIALLQVPIVGVRFFGLGRGLARYLERLATHDLTFRLLADLRVRFYQALEPLAPARLLSYHSGDLLSRILADVNTLENFYLRAVAPALVAAAVGLSMALFLAQYSGWLALALCGGLLGAGVGVPLVGVNLCRRPGREVIRARAALNAALVDGVQGMAELQAFSGVAWQAAKVSSFGRQHTAAQARLAWVGGLQTGLGISLANLTALAVLALAIPLVASGRVPGTHLAAVMLAALTSFEAILPLPAAAQTWESCLAAARRLFELVDAVPEVQPPAAPMPLPETLHLEIRELSFSYFPGNPVLRDVSFSLPPGRRLAIVGPSGAGKSTLARLLLRFWEYGPREGAIMLNGQPLRAYHPDELRRSLAVVSQPDHLFNASLRENLRLARPGGSAAEFDQAIQLAGLDAFVRALPQGYETLIGEGGQRLSGGERQRLVLARAFLIDASLLLLDEPTAHLDALTERTVLANALSWCNADPARPRSLLLITHRLAGLEAMDEILVLDQGQIAERGRFTELLAHRGLFYRLWQRQNPEINPLLGANLRQ